MKDKQHITIHIADAVLPLDIPPEKEYAFRTIEKELNSLYTYWSKAYHGKFSPNQVLAMVAFRFAQLFFELKSQQEADAQALDEAEKALDRILLDVK